MSETAPTKARVRAREMLERLRRRRRPPPVGEPRRLRMTVAYDGARFAGWQRQLEPVSVQELLEAALEEATGVPGSVFASGRTDAGVHAEGQVCVIDTTTALPPSAVEALLSMLLPRDVRVRDVAEAAPGFNPQKHARRKLYRYTLLRSPFAAPARERTAWRLDTPLDLDAMRAGASHLVGTHDFRAFRTDPGPERRDEDTVRRVDRVSLTEAAELVLLEVEGPGFLYMMVRNITAALVEVGAGRRDPSWIDDVLASRDRTRLPPPAPAAGLCLVRVAYA